MFMNSAHIEKIGHVPTPTCLIVCFQSSNTKEMLLRSDSTRITLQVQNLDGSEILQYPTICSNILPEAES